MYIELWKWIPGYEGYYMASTHGRIKSVDRYVGYKKSGQRLMKGKILKQSTDKGGYKIVQLNKNGKEKLFTVHRLVAQVFLENSSNLPQVNHKDENKQNNNVDNLEWISPKDNMNYGTRNERMSNSLKGRTFTEEHRKNISKVRKGKHHTEEAKKKISKSLKGKNNPNYGKQFTEEHKKKLSENHADYKGKKNPNAKPVLMFTLDGEFIRKFDCVRDANEYLGKDRDRDNISKCARGGSKTAWGYIWKYADKQ